MLTGRGVSDLRPEIIDPEAYLRHVRAWIADHPVKRIAELLPWNVSLEEIVKATHND
jgi:hypothetical protein